MKHTRSLLAIAGLLLGAHSVHAQGTAFTYQGRLTDNGAPASGIYDLRFTIYDALGGGNSIGSTVDVNDLGVTNGLFTATIDPGANVFIGAPRWLDISVRPGASVGAYTNVAPRQAITAAPYAITAGRVTGTVAAGQLTGTISPNNIAAGSINSTNLASGAVAANLNASGQAGVGSGGLVLSATENQALLTAGYVKIGATTIGETGIGRTDAK